MKTPQKSKALTPSTNSLKARTNVKAGISVTLYSWTPEEWAAWERNGNF